MQCNAQNKTGPEYVVMPMYIKGANIHTLSTMINNGM